MFFKRQIDKYCETLVTNVNLTATQQQRPSQDVEALLRLEDVAGKVADRLHAGQVEPAHDEVLAAGGGDDVLAGGDAPGHVAAAHDDPRPPRGEVAGGLQADS